MMENMKERIRKRRTWRVKNMDSGGYRGHMDNEKYG